MSGTQHISDLRLSALGYHPVHDTLLDYGSGLRGRYSPATGFQTIRLIVMSALHEDDLTAFAPPQVSFCGGVSYDVAQLFGVGALTRWTFHNYHSGHTLIRSK